MKNILTISLVSVLILFSSCEGDRGEQGPQGDPGVAGEKGETGKDGNTTSFYFQNGYKGYTGTTDATLFNSSDVFTDPPTPDGELLYAVSRVDGSDPTKGDSAALVIRFDEMATVLEEEFGASVCNGELYINEAVLFINGLYATIDVDAPLLEVGIFGSESPLFIETQATWNKANNADNWSKPGGSELWAYNDPYFVKAGMLNPGYHVNLESTNDIRSMRSLPIFIPREAIQTWLCESGMNKGLRLAVVSGFADVVVYSSEQSQVSLRPMLYLNIEKENSSTGRKAELTSEEAREIWDAKSYEEKMEPYYHIYSDEKL